MNLMPAQFYIPIILSLPPAQAFDREVVAKWIQQTYPSITQKYFYPPDSETNLSIEIVRQLISYLTLATNPNIHSAHVIFGLATSQPILQQALLKTLEEPPQNTLLIIVVPEQATLIATIRSRCHEVTGLKRIETSKNTLKTDDFPNLTEVLAGTVAQKLNWAEKFQERELAQTWVTSLTEQAHQKLTTQAQKKPSDPAVIATLLEAYRRFNSQASVRLILERMLFALSDRV